MRPRPSHIFAPMRLRPSHVRAARAVLKLSADELGRAVWLPRQVIATFEDKPDDDAKLLPGSEQALLAYFEARGVSPVEAGVIWRA